MDMADCHPACDSVPRKDSGGRSSSRVVPKRKAAARMRKSETNFIVDVFISCYN